MAKVEGSKTVTKLEQSAKLLKELQTWIKSMNLSTHKAASYLEIPYPTLRKYLVGARKPTQSVLKGLLMKAAELETTEPEVQEKSEQAKSGDLVVAELRAEIRRLKRRMLESRGMIETIREIVADEYSAPAKLILPQPPRLLGKGTEMVPIVHASDTQLGKVTNDYDSVVGAERLRAFAKKVVELIEIQRQHHKIDELQLYLGGDMVEGETGNYPSQPFDVDSSVLRQAMKNAPDIFEAMIYYFLKFVKKVNVKCVPGNHGRGAPKFATRHKETNWDSVFYWVLHDRVIGSDLAPKKRMRERVTFEIPEGDQFWVIDRVKGWGNLLVHGDQIKGWAGIPYYGIQKKVQGWADAMAMDWDYMFFGHFHTYASGTLNYRRWFGNGTTESSNSYALEELAAAGVPSQRVAFMTEKYGVVSDHQVYLTSDKDKETHLPLMKRRVKRSINEMGPDQFRIILDTLAK